MKKIIALLIFNSLFILAYSQTNKYYNANENWAQTSYSMTMGQPWNISPRYYWINGDSVIGGDTYKQLFYIEKTGGLPFVFAYGSYTNPWFLIKEENDTITILSCESPDGITDTATIFYNFDNMKLYFWQHYTDYTFDPIQSDSNYINYIIDTIYINGIPRKIMDTQNGQTYEGAFWCYGGSMIEPLTDPMQLDGYKQLQCYGGNDSVFIDYSGEIFPGNPFVLNPPVAGNCNIDTIWWSNVEAFNNTKLEIFPNPAFDIVNVDLGSLPIDEINIYDIRGVQVEQMGILTQIQIDNLLSGVYLIEVISNQHRYIHRFIKN